MNYRKLGHTGLIVPEFALGSWLTYGMATDDNTAFACLTTALDHGVYFLDTADVYNRGGAERVIGRYLSQNSIPRDSVVLATKAFFPMSDHVLHRGLSARHLHNSIDHSLQRLQTDYVDLYQCHRYDPETPLEEVCHTMHTLIQQGKIRYWGVSQWTAVQLLNALRVCERNGWVKPVSNQPIYNMLNRSLEVDVMDVCEQEGLGLLTYSPLAQGILTGKYKRGEDLPENARAGHPETSPWFAHKRLNERTFTLLEQLAEIASELGCSLAQLALAWCLRKQPLSLVILGASRPEQIHENLGALEVSITPELDNRLEEILGNRPVDQYTGQVIGHQGIRT